MPRALRPLFFGVADDAASCGGGCRDERLREESIVIVVGIGADGMAGLAAPSRAELAAPRSFTARDGSWTCWTTPSRRERRRVAVADAARAATPLRDVDGDVHVVASGDPLLHGVGGTLIRLFGADRVTVLPHVSSVTLACARLGWTVQDTEVISLSPPSRTPRCAAADGPSCCRRDGAGPAALARLLTDTGRGDSRD